MMRNRKSLRQWQAFLNESRIPIRLGVQNNAGFPIVISLWFTYLNGTIWCATKQSSKLVSYIRKKPLVGFEIASDEIPYCGIRGTAETRIDGGKGAEILAILMDRYLENSNKKLRRILSSNQKEEIAIELSPITVSTWDFSTRMKSAHNKQPEKPCP